MKCKNCGHYELWHVHQPGGDNVDMVCEYFKCDCPYFEELVEQPLPGMHYTAYAKTLESFHCVGQEVVE